MKVGRIKSNDSSRRRHSNPEESMPKPSGFSYRARRSEEALNTGRRPERTGFKGPALHTGRFWLQRSGMIVLLVAIIASLANILNLSPTAEIIPVTSANSASSVFNKSAYQAAADHLLAQSIWNRNKVTVDTGNISRQLLAQFPELVSVSITVPLLTHHPLIYIEPAKPALVIESAQSGSFVLNATGRAVFADTASSLVTQQAILPVVTDLSGLKLALGQQILPANTVSFIQNVTAEFAAKKLAMASMTLPPAASELDVTLVGKPYMIKFNLETNDPRQQVGTYFATITQLQSQGITPARYIDVRLDGRAYYQ